MQKNHSWQKYISLLFLGILLFGFILDFKAIYWGALNPEIFASPINVSLLLIYILAIILGFFIFLSYIFFHDVFIKTRVSFFQHETVRLFTTFIFSIFPILLFFYSPWSEVIRTGILRSLFYFSIIIILSSLWSYSSNKFFTFSYFVRVTITLSFLITVTQLFFRAVDYPFSLSWSEGNRYWDYSILFGSARYLSPSQEPITAFIDQGRQFLWGIIFLLPNLSIGGMRLWHAVILIAPSFLLGWLIFRKSGTNKIVIGFCAMWVFLFLNQGPIYSPLIVSAILTYTAYSSTLPISIPLILIAGYLANISRYTWIIAPPIWILLLFILNKKPGTIDFKDHDWQNTVVKIFCGIGGGIIFPSLLPQVSQSLEANPQSADSIFSKIILTLSNQQLIWSRLLPNPSNQLGVLLGLTIAILPIILLIISFLMHKTISFPDFSIFIISTIFLVFLIIGLIVSVKIGGGGNLHNVDMFLISVVFLVGSLWHGSAKKWLIHSQLQNPLEKVIIILLILIPSSRIALNSSRMNPPNEDKTEEIITFIQNQINEKKKYGEILFIDQRQLLTFHYLEEVPLTVEYEKKLLMDKALSGDKKYFSNFYEDLKRGRFSLIINEPLWIEYKENSSFAEENNAYVYWVSEPLACYYQPLATFNDVEIEILIPRTFPSENDVRCP